MKRARMHAERGAALVVGLIMLVLITIMLITALNLGTANFRSVSNMQFREEAIAAANRAIELVISSDFAAPPVFPATGEQEIGVDIDQDDPDNPDYIVNVARPRCVQATIAEEFPPSEEELGPTLSAASTWNTVWDIQATVVPADNAGGAGVVVHAGVRKLLTQTQRDLVCP